MSRYPRRSWRSFDPQAFAARPAAAAASPVARVVRAPADARPLRILGLDPGSRRTGFGIIERRGGQYAHIAHGVLNVGGAAIVERLRHISDGLKALIDEHRPAEVAVERVFVKRNVASALKLGQARGAALCAVPEGTAVFEYAPRAIKLAVVGSGNAQKSQVVHMIRALLHLEGALQLDASDALAVAVCHAHSRELKWVVEGQALGPAGLS
jgi:crossover junction endodeoxyribonuclease RuvC